MFYSIYVTGVASRFCPAICHRHIRFSAEREAEDPVWSDTSRYKPQRSGNPGIPVVHW